MLKITGLTAHKQGESGPELPLCPQEQALSRPWVPFEVPELSKM